MDKVWLKHYQEGVPHEIDANEYDSIVSFFEISCRKFANQVAYVNLGTELTYADLDKYSAHFAVYLQQLGLKKGARVALMMPNILQYPIALFGALRAGYIVVNTNPLYTPDEFVHQMNDSGAEALVVMANFAITVEHSLTRLTTVKHIIVTQIGDCFPLIKGLIINAVVKYVKKSLPSYNLPQAICFKKTLELGKKGTLTPVSLNHEDIVFLQYTGGTTGISKGSMLTHGNMVSNVLQASAWIRPMGLDAQEVVITALPLYHIFSLCANCLAFLGFGVKNILITNPRDIPHFIKEIKDVGFTVITGVNTLFNALLNNPTFKKVDFSKLRCSLAGGMALQRAVSIKWKEVTNHPIIEAYGLTETCPAVTINPLNLKEYNGSIGLPLPSTDISIRNDEEEELPFNVAGELCIKGPQVMLGYWQRPEETEQAFTKDGFFKSGDIAKVDENGYVYLVDRKKDLIVVSGFNVYPNEVEQVISMLPGVLEVGVVGVEDEDSGERVKACIVKRDPALTEVEVIAHCREHLTAYKIPKIVAFYQDLPKTNVGKILRRALKNNPENLVAVS